MGVQSESESVEAARIGEKVRFWEEQDRINQALIPRVLETHELLMKLEKNREDAAEVIARLEARAVSAERELQCLKAELHQQKERLRVLAEGTSPPTRVGARDEPPATPEADSSVRMIAAGACGVAALAVIVLIAGYGAIGGGIAILASTIAAFGAVRR